jgi:hypothetical protein
MGDETAEVASYYAVPCRAFAAVELENVNYWLMRSTNHH